MNTTQMQHIYYAIYACIAVIILTDFSSSSIRISFNACDFLFIVNKDKHLSLEKPLERRVAKLQRIDVVI